ncbi:MAG: class I SAM-dependent methyltransferase [Candidatus Ranarchaeia archaeon]
MSYKKKVMQRLYDTGPDIYHDRYFSIQREKYRFISSIIDSTNLLTLEVGIGTGIVYNVFQYLSRIIGLDISIRSLEYLLGRSAYPNLLLVNADAECLPFRDCSIQQIFSITVAQNLPSPKPFLTESRRVLSVRGRLIFSILRKKDCALYDAIRSIFPGADIVSYNDPIYEDLFFIIST